MALLSFRGVEEEGLVIESTNKNGVSIYALPAVLIAIYVILRTDWKHLWLRRLLWPVLLGCIGLTSYIMLTNENRSGYVGLALIVMLMFVYVAFTPRFRVVGRTWGFILLGVLTASTIGILIGLQATKAFERRLEQTEEGIQSDRLRVDLFWTSFQIGLENPILGRSPQQLPYELGRRLSSYGEPMIDTHNVFAHLIGGAGVICTLAFILAALAFWFWRPPGMRRGQGPPGFYDARNFLRMTLVLFAVRGLFSREVLYNPSFCMAIGLAIGLCIVEGEAAKRGAQQPPQVPFGQVPQPLPARA